jgi:tetratricopeptide (TPR) repeat protein
MNRVVYFILFLVVFNCFFFSQERFLMDEKTFQRFKQAKRMYVKGEQLYLKGKLSKAQKSLEKCVELFPEYSEAYFVMAQILYVKREYGAALEKISNAKTHFKYMANIRVSAQMDYIGDLGEQSQKLKDRLQELQRKLGASGSTGQRSQLETQMGTIQSQLNRIEGQIRTPVPTFEQLPAEYHYVHGNILFKLKKFHEAKKQYLEAVEVDQNHGNALNNVAILLFLEKKYRKAKEFLDRAEASGMVINQNFKRDLEKALEK